MFRPVRTWLLAATGVSMVCLSLAATAMADNPLLPDFHADPAIHYFPNYAGADKYWMYASTDEPDATLWRDMKQWYVYSSSNLLNWESHGPILSLDDLSWGNAFAFDPDGVYANGQYYLYYSANGNSNSGGLGVAVGPTPYGPFTDLGHPMLTRAVVRAAVPEINFACSAAVFIDDDGQPYMYFGQNGGLGAARLNDDMISLDGAILNLSSQLTGYFMEGPWMHKKDGVYYLSFEAALEGSTPGYRPYLGYATSTSPLGPFTFRGYINDNSSRNNQGSIIEIDGQSYLFYHEQSTGQYAPYRRRVLADYLHYNLDGTIQMAPMTDAGIGPLPSVNPNPHFLLDFRNDPADAAAVTSGDLVYVNSVARHFSEQGVQGLAGDEAVWYMDNAANAVRTFQGVTVTTSTLGTGDKYSNASGGAYDDIAVLDGYLRSNSTTHLANTITLSDLGNVLRPFDSVTLWLFGAGDSVNDGTDFQVLYGGDVIGSGYTLYGSTPALSFSFQTDSAVLDELVIRWSNHNNSYDGVVSGLALTAISRILGGDCDRNGSVNFSDLGVLIANYNKPGGWASGDFDGDGTVTFDDLGTLISNYNQTLSAIPEPSSLALLGLAALTALRRRRTPLRTSAP